MTDVIDKLIIEIAGDARKFKGSIREMKSASKDGTASLKALGKVGVTTFTALGGAATALGVKATNAFKDFETGVTNVAKTTNLTGKDLEDFKDNIISMSEEMPVTTDRLLEIATAAGQLGITGVKDLTKFTQVIAKLGATTNVEGEEAALTLARLLNITGESVDTVDRLGAALVDLGNNFAASEAEILEISKDLGKATVQFGLSSDAILGMSAAMASLGVQAEAGGTVVGKAFQQISNIIRSQAGPEFEKLQKLTNLTGEELTRVFQEDASQVFSAFIQGLGDSGAAGNDMAKELNDLGLSGIRVEKILPTLASRSDILADALKRAGIAAEENSALNEEAAKAFSTSASQLEIAQNKINNLFIEVGETIAPSVVDAITEIGDIIRTSGPVIEGLGKSFAFTFKAITKTVGALQYLGTWLNAITDGEFAYLDSISEVSNQEYHLNQMLKERGITLDEFKKKQAELATERKKASAENLEQAKKEQAAQQERTSSFLQSTSDYIAADNEQTKAVQGNTKARLNAVMSTEQQAEKIRADAKALELQKQEEHNQKLLDQELEAANEMFNQIQIESDEIERQLEDRKTEIVEIDQDKWDELSLQQQEAYIAEIDAAIQQNQELGQLEKAGELERYKQRLTATQDNEKLNDKFLKNLEKRQEKHGKIMGTLTAIQEDSRYNQTKDALNALTNLQDSKYKEQKELGKAASIVQIGISTAEAAMKAFNGLAWIPYVGWALGGIAAAAVIGYGLEQVNQVRAMKEGGIVPGVGTGDKVPALLEPGELVVPRNMTREIMQEYNARMMANGGLATGEDQKNGMQDTFNKIFSVPQVFKSIIDGEEPETNVSGLGASDMARLPFEMMDALQAAADELEYEAIRRTPGGEYINKISKGSKESQEKIQGYLQDNAAVDALKSIIGEEGVYNLFGGSSTLDALQDNITSAANDFVSGLLGGIFGFKNGGVPGMVSPGEMRLSKKALSAIANGMSMQKTAQPISRPSNRKSSGMNGGISKTVVEISMRDDAAQIINAQIKNEESLGTLIR